MSKGKITYSFAFFFQMHNSVHRNPYIKGTVMNIGRTSTESRAFISHRDDFEGRSKCLVESDAMQSNGHVPTLRKDLHHQHRDTLKDEFTRSISIHV
jgi:hypothetical protein